MNRLLRLATASVLALLAAAAPAAADNPPADRQDLPGGQGPLLGGGTIGLGALIPSDMIRLRLAADGTQLNFIGAVSTLCDDDAGASMSAGAYNIPLGADGKFAGSVPTQSTGGAGSTSGTWSYSGTVVGGDSATGTARLQFTITYNDGRKVDCDSGKITWTVRDPNKKPGAGTLRKNARYYGIRPDTKALAFRTTTDGKSISNFGFENTFLAEHCKEGGGFLDPGAFDIRAIKIKEGKFSYKKTFTENYGGGATARITIRLSGKFGKSRVSGKLYYRVEGSQDGKLVSDCQTPTMPWNAER